MTIISLVTECELGTTGQRAQRTLCDTRGFH